MCKLVGRGDGGRWEGEGGLCCNVRDTSVFYFIIVIIVIKIYDYSTIDIITVNVIVISCYLITVVTMIVIILYHNTLCSHEYTP